jgi:CO/xanthine dehydrogenase FAD-binding subunit
MIPYSFDYYRPDTISEALETYHDLDAAGKTPVYYSGGSEIISMARVNNLSTKAVIDLKVIAECSCQENRGDHLVIGSSVTLSSITEANHFPLLSKSCGRIADHTMQCKITLGGNICGTIIYREALLPLLLSDTSVVIASKDKCFTLPLHDIYNHKLNLKEGDFIVQFIIEGKYLSLPYFHIKKTKNEKIDYPLITLAALLYEGQVRLAFSGLCEYPFRSKKIESAWNEAGLQKEARVHELINRLPGSVLNDISGSDQYRLFVLKTTLLNLERALEENACSN